MSRQGKLFPEGSSEQKAAPASAVTSVGPDLDQVFGGLDFSARRAVVVAVSGGSDSLALLFLLRHYLDDRGVGVRPVAVTVDHRLRAEGTEEAQLVGEIARGIGIDHHTVTWAGPKPAAGISAAAREARHRLLATAAAGAGTDLVLAGHTMDDQAETVEMRRRRGGGRGEAGIAPATLFDGRCWFARPLLDQRRGALRRYLTGIGQRWIDDPSNEDRRFERARLRAALAEGEVEELARKAALAASAREKLGRHAAGLIAARASKPAPGLVRLGRGFGAVEDRAAAFYALRILLATMGGREQLPDVEKAKALFDRLSDFPLRATLSRTVIDGRKAGIFLYRERRGLPGLQPFAPGIWDGRFRIEGSADDGQIGPAGEGGLADMTDEQADTPASLVRAALAVRPALFQGDRTTLLDAAKKEDTRAMPLVTPWARYLPLFDLAPARAVAALIGADDNAPPPLAGHNRPEP